MIDRSRGPGRGAAAAALANPAVDGAPSGARRWTPFLAVILLLALLLRLGLALRPPAEIDDLVMPDDAYLSLTIARNLALGHGPLYGTAPTNGYQPLYVFLAAPFYRLWPNDLDTPLRASLVMLAVFDVAGLALLLRLVRRFSVSRAAPLAAAAAWALDPYSIATAANGLETSLAFFFLAGALDRAARSRLEPGLWRQKAHLLALGAWLGLAGLARIDSLALVPVLLIAMVLDARREGARWGEAARAALGCGVVAGLIFAPWPAYSWMSTHSLFPVSGRAVRYQVLSPLGHHPTFANHYWPMILKAANTIARENPVRGAAILALACLLPWIRPRPAILARLRAHTDAVAFAAILVIAYVFVFFGYWHFSRYFYPVALALTLLTAALVDLFARAGSRAAHRVAMASVIAIALGSVLIPPFPHLYAPVQGTWGYRDIGEWAARRFPKGTVIGGTQTGGLAYFAPDLTVINLDGVVNNAAYRALRERRLWDYMRSEEIEWLVWQDDIEFLSRESANGRAPRLGPPERIPGIITWGGTWDLWRVEDSVPARVPGTSP